MIWVAQVTEPATQGEHNEQFEALQRRFPQYHFSIMMGEQPYIICRPVDETVQHPSDIGTENEILRFIVTSLIDELVTGHLIVDERAGPHGLNQVPGGSR